MKTIVCIDDKLGMLFDGKRQSRDRGLIENLMGLVGDERLIISPFSSELFEGRDVKVSRRALSEAKKGDFVFIEDTPLLPYLEEIEEIVIYKWNRTYPRDLLLDLIPSENGFTLYDSTDFIGTSHKKITREVYKR